MEDYIWDYLQRYSEPWGNYKISRFSTSPYWSVLKKREATQDLIVIGKGDTLKEAVMDAIKEEEGEEDE